MAFLRLTAIVAFACVVQAFPKVGVFDPEDGWQTTASIISQTSVLDGSLKQVQAFPKVGVFDPEDGWQTTASIISQTSVLDGSLKQVQAFPKVGVLDPEDGWQTTASIISQTSVLDGSLKQVQAFPKVGVLDPEDGWQTTATIISQTSVLDGSLKQVAFVNITVRLLNYTQDSYQIVSDTLRRNLAKIPLDSEPPHDNLRMYEGVDSKLPLTFNMTLAEVVSTGPKPFKAVGMLYHCDVYAKKKHRSDVLASLKTFPL